MNNNNSIFESSQCYRSFQDELTYFQRRLWSEDHKEFSKRLKSDMDYYERTYEIIKVYGEHTEKLGKKYLELLVQYLDLNQHGKLDYNDIKMLRIHLERNLKSILSSAKHNIQAQAASMGWRYSENEHSHAYRTCIEEKINDFMDLVPITVNKYNASVDNRTKTNSASTFNFYGDFVNSQFNHQSHNNIQYNRDEVEDLFNKMSEVINADTSISDINKRDIMSNIITTKLELNNSKPDKLIVKNKLDSLAKYSTIGNFVIKVMELLRNFIL